MILPRLDNNSQLSPLLDGEQGQGDQQRAVQGHLVKVVQGCSRLGENFDGTANLEVRHVDKPKWFICELVALCDLSIPRKGTLKQ